jgi:hypothetical protein
MSTEQATRNEAAADDSLRLTARTLRYGCGIYEAGDTEKCYVKLFVTDDGFVLPVNHRVITEEDLIEVYVQGRMRGQREASPDSIATGTEEEA